MVVVADVVECCHGSSQGVRVERTMHTCHTDTNDSRVIRDEWHGHPNIQHRNVLQLWWEMDDSES